MHESLLLFDADDTLFDFTKSQQVSFQSTLDRLGLGGRFEELYGTYVQASRKLWKQLERGEVSKDAVKVERFRFTFHAHGIALDPDRASELYLESLPENVFLIPGAVEVCGRLAASHRIGILTNGVEHVQRRRLANSELRDLVEFMVVSEECGFVKPDVRIFEYTMEKAKLSDRSRVLMIGDSLEADILGARRAGIRSCWFNPKKARNETGIEPDLEIHALHDLFDLDELTQIA
jgi:2-haloacid dehalogenase